MIARPHSHWLLALAVMGCSKAASVAPSDAGVDAPPAAAPAAASGKSAAEPAPAASGLVRGTVAPGGKCMRRPWKKEAERFEHGDDCAPVARWTSAGSPKGSVCVMESGPGAYCTHDCKTDDDCKDVRRDGFVTTCEGGGCFLTKR